MTRFLTKAKRLTALTATAFALALSLIITSSAPASASSPLQITTTSLAARCDGVLTFPSWCRNLDLDDKRPCLGDTSLIQDSGSCDPIGDWIGTVLANVLEILFQLVGYAAVIMIIYGGFKFVMSNGYPDRQQDAQRTISQAIIGLIVGLLGTGITRTAVNVANEIAGTGTGSITPAINQAMFILGILSVVYATYGAFTIVTAAGSPDKVKKGRNAIIYACVGVVVAIAAVAIANLIVDGVAGRAI